MIILGIDIGGSGIKGDLVDINNGELTTPRYRVPTPQEAKPDDVALVIKDIADHFNYQGVIGCGFPAVVRQGLVLTAANIDQSWIDMDGAELFSTVTNRNTFLVNDADAAGIAEMAFGAGKDFHRGVVLMITLGTGIGSAIFTDGCLLPNTEFGHMQIRGKDAEWRASDAARQRKQLSWDRYAVRLEEFLNVMEALIWPDLIIIGGGVSKYFAEFIPHLDVKTSIVPAQMLNQAGMVGAALYASEQEAE